MTITTAPANNSTPASKGAASANAGDDLFSALLGAAVQGHSAQAATAKLGSSAPLPRPAADAKSLTAQANVFASALTATSDGSEQTQTGAALITAAATADNAAAVNPQEEKPASAGAPRKPHGAEKDVTDDAAVIVQPGTAVVTPLETVTAAAVGTAPVTTPAIGTAPVTTPAIGTAPVTTPSIGAAPTTAQPAATATAPTSGQPAATLVAAASTVPREPVGEKPFPSPAAPKTAPRTSARDTAQAAADSAGKADATLTPAAAAPAPALVGLDIEAAATTPGRAPASPVTKTDRPAAQVDTSTVVPTAPAPVLPAPTAAPAAAPTAPVTPVPQQPLNQQLAQPMMSLATAENGDQTIVVRVAPNELGPVTVRAHLSDTTVRFELFAPTEAGRDALRHILPELRADINSAAGNGFVNLSDQNGPSADSKGHAQQQGAQPQEGNRRGITADAGQDAPENRTIPHRSVYTLDVLA